MKPKKGNGPSPGVTIEVVKGFDAHSANLLSISLCSSEAAPKFGGVSGGAEFSNGKGCFVNMIDVLKRGQ